MVSPWKTKASCSIAKAASCIPTVMPRGQMTSSICRFVLGARLQGRLSGTPFLTSAPCGGLVRISLMRDCGSTSNRLGALGGRYSTASSLLFLCFCCGSFSLSFGLRKTGELCPWWEMNLCVLDSWCHLGSRGPVPSQRVPRVTRADIKEGRWLAINRLVKEKDYPFSCEY